MMDMVPPLTVRMPASLRITSFGLVQPLSSPVSLTPITSGHLSSQGMSAITSMLPGFQDQNLYLALTVARKL